jgi:hypothetical protein
MSRSGAGVAAMGSTLKRNLDHSLEINVIIIKMSDLSQAKNLHRNMR